MSERQNDTCVTKWKALGGTLDKGLQDNPMNQFSTVNMEFLQLYCTELSNFLQILYKNKCLFLIIKKQDNYSLLRLYHCIFLCPGALLLFLKFNFVQKSGIHVHG